VHDIEVLDHISGTTYVQKPDIATAVVFRSTADRPGDLIVLGPRTRASYNPGKAARLCVRARLRPGQARALLGVSPADLVDRAVPLTDLWGRAADRLADRMAADGDDTGRVVERLREAVSLDRGNPLVPAALGRLTGAARLSEVAARLGVSERHLRTVFAREIGLSPKHVARINRVHDVLALAGRRGWAAVAGDAGFFDQAHMIGDFRSLMGVAPGDFLAGRFPVTTPCGSSYRTASV
jgi:AraC-like DNA-binding protein